jgi:hypothetical protein
LLRLTAKVTEGFSTVKRLEQETVQAENDLGRIAGVVADPADRV